MAHRVTQQALEVIVIPESKQRVTQQAVEVIVASGEIHLATMEMGAAADVAMVGGKYVEASLWMPVTVGPDPVVSGADPVIARWRGMELGSLPGVSDWAGTPAVGAETTIEVGALTTIDLVGEAMHLTAFAVGAVPGADAVGEAIRVGPLTIGGIGSLDFDAEVTRQALMQAGSLGAVTLDTFSDRPVVIEVGGIGVAELLAHSVRNGDVEVGAMVDLTVTALGIRLSQVSIGGYGDVHVDAEAIRMALLDAGALGDVEIGPSEKTALVEIDVAALAVVDLVGIVPNYRGDIAVASDDDQATVSTSSEWPAIGDSAQTRAGQAPTSTARVNDRRKP